MRVSPKNISTLAIVLGLAVLGNACNRAGKAVGGGEVGVTEADPGQGSEDAEQQAKKEKAQKEEDYASAFSVLNFRQLAATFSELTGVTLENPAVLQAYESQLSSLPTNPDPTAISSSQVSAATKLAAAFCDVLSTDAALRAQKFPDIDFAAPPASINSDAFADTLLTTFFGPQTALQGDRETDIGIVAELVDNLKTVVPTTQGVTLQTTSIFMGACASVLSSAEFYLY